MPWVTRLKEPTARCDGIRWSNVSRKTLPLTYGPADGLPDRIRCRLRGWWSFRRRAGSSGTSGTYCWHHLMQQLYLDDYRGERGEAERTRRWLDRNAPEPKPAAGSTQAG